MMDSMDSKNQFCRKKYLIFFFLFCMYKKIIVDLKNSINFVLIINFALICFPY